MSNRRSLRARPNSVGDDMTQQNNEEREPKRERLRPGSSDLPELEDGSQLFLLSCPPFIPLAKPLLQWTNNNNKKKEKKEKEQGWRCILLLSDDC